MQGDKGNPLAGGFPLTFGSRKCLGIGGQGIVSWVNFDLLDLGSQGDKGNPLAGGFPLTFGSRNFLGICGLGFVSRVNFDLLDLVLQGDKGNPLAGGFPLTPCTPYPFPAARGLLGDLDAWAIGCRPRTHGRW